MQYTEKKLKLITKFNLTDLYYSIKKNNLSSLFWYNIFNKDNLKDFLYKKYIPFKVKNNTINDKIISEIKFCLNKIDQIKLDINLIEQNKIKIEDLFLSYLVFNKILEFYNDFYKSSNISISLSNGLQFSFTLDKTNKESLNDIKLQFLENNNLINELIIPLFKNFSNDNNLYVFKIFWPTEIILAFIFGKYIKEKTNNSKILLDVSEANEQFDYTQWNNFIEENNIFLSNYLDYIVLYRDFGSSINQLLKYLNKENVFIESNLIILEKQNYKNFKLKDGKINNYILSFIKKTFSDYKKYIIFGKNTIYSRMFPYKCYWSKCNFCTINSQNNINFDNNYNYDFFIDKWIKFIKENNIHFLHFADEAIPPNQIIKFAKKIIEEKLDIIYQFRTRFDKLYTKENCEILYKSGARFVGIGLESIVERINEGIGNKGQSHISLEEKENIIQNFDNAKIPFHNYSIIGFPTETKEETLETYDFLIKNINKYNYYTSTPNLFGLMKGSYIYNNLSKYGIIIKNKYKDNLFNLRYDFNYINGEERTLNFYKKLSNNIHIEQFTPWLKGKQNLKIIGFWDYIDRSSFFYKMKIIYEKNPYIEYMNINKNILNKNFNEILNNYFDLSKGFQILKKDNNNLYLYDWINCVNFDLSLNYYNFLIYYDNKVNLLKNLEKNKLIIDKEKILFLIENRILVKL